MGVGFVGIWTDLDKGMTYESGTGAYETVWGGLEEGEVHFMRMSNSAYRVATELEPDIIPPGAQEMIPSEPEGLMLAVDLIGNFVF
jgi:hypothetical protein